jgi:hypothetical protein
MNDNPTEPVQVTWQVESTHPELVEKFKETMREVEDPE